MEILKNFSQIIIKQLKMFTINVNLLSSIFLLEIILDQVLN